MISVQRVVLRVCPLLLLLLYPGCQANVSSGCSWSQWGSCSVTCGKGIRSRVGSGSDCTQPSTEKCSVKISCYAGHLANLGVTVTQHPLKPINPVRVTSYVINGWPDITTPKGPLNYLKCGQTGRGDNPWVRLDLKKAYLVSSVRVITFSYSGKNVVVRVGNSLTNNGNDNHECGPVPYNAADSTQIIWRNVSCFPSVWGTYINFQRTVTDGPLEICEAVFSYDASLDASVDITIKKGGSNVSGTTERAIKEQGLVQSIDCAVNKNNLTAYLTWKHEGKTVPGYTSVQQPDIYQVNGLQSQRLYIKKTSDSDGGVYSCQLSIENTILLSKSFTLNVVGCVWSSWSPCSMTCGVGRRTRIGNEPDCRQSAECNDASCYVTHLSSLGVTITQHPENTQRPRRPKELVIDGMPTTVNGQTITPSSCTSTDQGDNPWVQLDLKKAYLVSVVRVIIYGSTGQDVAVRVGNSLTNNGNDNRLCGNFPYVSAQRTKAIWRDVPCSPSVWGRYINFQRTVTDHYLEICEAAFRYDAIVDMRIERNGANVDGQSLSVDKGHGLSEPIDCTENATYSVSLTWKFGNDNVQTLSSGQPPGIYQVNENNVQRLYITKTSASANGVYSCHASVRSDTVLSKSFVLNFKVSCKWSDWSACSQSCGVGQQTRRKDHNKQHGGKDCEGPSTRSCVKRLCPPTVSNSRVSVDEGTRVELSCNTLRIYSTHSITFGWFKVQGMSSVSVKSNGRMVNTTTSGGGRKFIGKLTFTNANRKDDGQYKCKAYHKNGISPLSAAAALDVKYGPESVSIHLAKSVGVKGQTFTFNCSALGNPSPSYFWKLPDDTQRHGKTLTLSNVQFTDEGIYTCYATVRLAGGIKTANSTVKLRVEDKPPPPRLCNGHLIAPDISNSKGPIKFVDILIYGSSMTDGAPNEREIPYDSEAYTDNKDWYMIRYSWEKYKSSIAHNPISIEDILTTIGGETLTQTSVKGLSTYAHYVYIRVVALDSSGRNVTLVSEAAHYTVPTVVPAMVSSDSGSGPAIIAVVVVAIVVTMATVIIIVMLKRRIQHLQTLLHNDKNAGVSMELADATCNPAYDTACLSESKAPLPGESYKSGEEGYEELSSCTCEKDEHTYQDVDNLK